MRQSMKTHLLLGVVATLVLMWGCGDDDTTAANTDITISSVDPTQGSAGTVVTITGTNFGSDKTAIVVLFGNASRVATIDNIIGGKQIVTKVPDIALEGNIHITVMKGATSADIPFTTWNAIVAKWKSEGESQVAPALWDSLKMRRIVATFNANATYTITSTDSAGANTGYTGTFTKTGPNSSWIYAVRVHQTAPAGVDTLKGIYR